MSNIYFSSFGNHNPFYIDLPHNSVETGFLCGVSTHRGIFPSLALHPKVQCPLNCINRNGSISWSQRQLHWKAGYRESLKIYFRKIQREFSGFLLAYSQLAVTMTTTIQWQLLALPLPFISKLKVAFLRLRLTLPWFPLAFPGDTRSREVPRPKDLPCPPFLWLWETAFIQPLWPSLSSNR